MGLIALIIGLLAFGGALTVFALDTTGKGITPEELDPPPNDPLGPDPTVDDVEAPCDDVSAVKVDIGHNKGFDKGVPRTFSRGDAGTEEAGPEVPFSVTIVRNDDDTFDFYDATQPVNNVWVKGGPTGYLFQYYPEFDPGVFDDTGLYSPQPGWSHITFYYCADAIDPNLEITKSADTEVSKIGDVINYTVTVTNSGNVDLEVVVDDSLEGQLFDGMIDAGESETFEYAYIVGEGDTDPLENTVTAVGTAPVLQDSLVVSDSAEVKLVTPSVNLTKTVTPTTAEVGDTVTYTIRVENTGDWGLENLTVTDPMLGGNITEDFDFDSVLAEDGSREASFSYEIQPGDVDVNSQVVNTASVYSNPVDLPNDIEDEDSAEVNIIGPALTIIKEANTYVSKVGDDIEYTVVVANTGDVALEVQVVDSLMGALSDGGFMLLPGEDETFEYTYTVQEGDENPLDNIATARGWIVLNNGNMASMVVAAPDVEVSDNASVPLVEPEVLLSKSVSPTLAQVGATVTYTIRVENTGDWALENIEVTDALLGGDITDAFEFGESLLPDEWEEAQFEYVVQEEDIEDGFVINTASVYSNPVDLPNDIEDEDSAQLEILTPNLLITKEANTEVSKVGDEIQYTVTIENAGDVDLFVEVTDSLFPEEVLWSGMLNADDEPVTLEPYIYVVQEGDPDPLVNVATAYGWIMSQLRLQEVDLGPADFTVSASVATPLVEPEVTLTKTVSPTQVEIGDTVTYTITVENTGDWALDNLSVTDPMFGGDITEEFGFGDELVPGASETAVFNKTITSGDVDADDRVINTASVYSNPLGLPNDIEDDDSATVTIRRPTDPVTGIIRVEKEDNEGSAMEDVTFILTAPGEPDRTMTTNAQGVARFTDLPLNKTYTLTEDPDDWGDWTATYNPSNSIRLESGNRFVTVQVTNTPEPDGSITVQKVDGDGVPMAGILFTLMGEDDDMWQDTTDAQGRAVFSELPLGVTYTLNEELDDEDEWFVEYDPGQVIALTQGEANVTVTVTNFLEEEEEIIDEEPAAEPEEEEEEEEEILPDLPYTGGAGMALAYVGAALVAAGVLLKRKGQRQ